MVLPIRWQLAEDIKEVKEQVMQTTEEKHYKLTDSNALIEEHLLPGHNND